MVSWPSSVVILLLEGPLKDLVAYAVATLKEDMVGSD